MEGKMKSIIEFKEKINNCDVLNIIQIPVDLIDSDVLDRLNGTEVFKDTEHKLNENIYSVDNLKEGILDDTLDDTNETTKSKIEILYFALFNYDYFMITKI